LIYQVENKSDSTNTLNTQRQEAGIDGAVAGIEEAVEAIVQENQ
jgi:hypothetical protein